MADHLKIRSIHYRDAPSTYYIAPHSHQGLWQWYMVRHGHVSHTIEGHDFILEEGESILIPPDVNRSPRSMGPGPSYLVVTFATDRFNLRSLAGKVVPLCDEALFADIISELDQPVDGNADLMVQVLVTQLLVKQLRTHRGAIGSRFQNEGHGDLSQQDVCARAISFMRSHLHESISRADIAKAVHYSDPHFARLFRQTMGVTPGQYLSELRIERAKLFLTTSTLSISQIALEVGFQSFSHFTQLFKQRTGESPSAFRGK